MKRNLGYIQANIRAFQFHPHYHLVTCMNFTMVQHVLEAAKEEYVTSYQRTHANEMAEKEEEEVGEQHSEEGGVNMERNYNHKRRLARLMQSPFCQSGEG